jgi:hypothetical protein
MRTELSTGCSNYLVVFPPDKVLERQEFEALRIFAPLLFYILIKFLVWPYYVF